VASLAVVGGLVVACSSQELAGLGGSCNLATDCQDGLACVPQANGTRVCSNDLSGVQKPFQPGGGADAAGGDGAMGDGEAPADTGPLPDVTVKDTGPPVQDTGADAPPPTDGGAG